MKPLILLILLTLPAVAQTPKEGDWKLIKEMSGPLTQYPGFNIETHAAEIARGDDKVKMIVRFSFPQGAPFDMFRDSVPRGFDVSTIARVEGKVQLHCQTLEFTAIKGTLEAYQFSGKKYKSKEAPFKIDSGHVFAQYFCEQGSAPTKAPTLKPK